jgi:hypothetical protein
MGTKYGADVICTLKNDPDMPVGINFEGKKLEFQKIRDSETGLAPVQLLKHKDRPKFENAVAKSTKLNGSNGYHKNEREILEFSK